MPSAYHALNKCYLLYPFFPTSSLEIICAVLSLQQSLEICGYVFNKHLLTTYYVLHIVLGRDERHRTPSNVLATVTQMHQDSSRISNHQLLFPHTWVKC